MALFTLLEYLFDFLVRWIRQSRLERYAKSRGYAFRSEDLSNSTPFSDDIFDQDPSREYKQKRAANIIRGSMSGLMFTYFEKTLLKVGGFCHNNPAGTRSIVVFDNSATDYFESEKAIDNDLSFYRENGQIWFWWSGGNAFPNAIPAKELERWLAEIANTFKTEVRGQVLGSRAGESWQ